MRAHFVKLGDTLALIMPSEVLERRRVGEGVEVHVSETEDGRVVLEFGPTAEARREDAEYLVPEQDQ